MKLNLECHIPNDPDEIAAFVDEVNSGLSATITFGEPELQKWDAADDLVRERERNALREEIIAHIADKGVDTFVVTAEDGTILSLAKHKQGSNWRILDVDGEMRGFMGSVED